MFRMDMRHANSAHRELAQSACSQLPSVDQVVGGDGGEPAKHSAKHKQNDALVQDQGRYIAYGPKYEYDEKRITRRPATDDGYMPEHLGLWRVLIEVGHIVPE